MKSRPFFSVVIATFNRGDLITKAIESLLSQTDNDWEAIIVDDDSNDDTYCMVSPYLETYPRIKYIKKEHSGEAMTKNAGICSSTGKYVTFLDADDEYDPFHLESRKAILASDPSIEFLHGGASILGNQFVPDRFDLQKQVSLSECTLGGTFFIERNTLFKLRGFKNIFLGADADLLDRATDAGVTMKVTDLPTYIYHHEVMDSITNMLYTDLQHGNKRG